MWYNRGIENALRRDVGASGAVRAQEDIPVSDNDSTTPLKRCNKCGKEYPATTEFFHMNVGKLRPRCKPCHREATYGWKKRNPEKNKEIGRNGYHRNLEANREKNRQRYWRNPEKKHRADRDRYLSNPEKKRQYNLEYAKKNPERYRVIGQRRRARVRSLPDTLTYSQWQRCLEYFQGCCAVCGRPTGLWHTLAQDHWIPVSRGGGSTPQNIIPLCHSRKDGDGGCNNSKYNKMPDQWLVELWGNKKAQQIIERINEYFEWAKSIDNE